LPYPLIPHDGVVFHFGFLSCRCAPEPSSATISRIGENLRPRAPPTFASPSLESASRRISRDFGRRTAPICIRRRATTPLPPVRPESVRRRAADAPSFFEAVHPGFELFPIL
jgi:hypothetical protein